MNSAREYAVQAYIELFPQTSQGTAKYSKWVGSLEWLADLTPEELIAFCQLVRLAEARK